MIATAIDFTSTLSTKTPICLCLALIAIGCQPTVQSPSSLPTDPSAVVLDCGKAIDVTDDVPSDYKVILGVVALPTSDSATTALQANVSGENDPAARLFAKTGLMVRTGTSFELSVPPEIRDRMSIDWGGRTWELLVPSCEGDKTWKVFAGGFLVRDPTCASLTVRIGPDEQTVSIGVGAPCAGQEPPPEPTAD